MNQLDHFDADATDTVRELTFQHGALRAVAWRSLMHGAPGDPDRLEPPDEQEQDPMSDPAEHAQMCEDCETREQRLSDYERGFVDSIKAQLAAGRTLTKKQADKLEEIWDRATDGG